MGDLWTDENKYRCWLKVEAAASMVLAEDAIIPAAAAEAIATKATVSAARVAEIEAARPGGHAAMAVEGGKLALFGCTVTPGFDFADYRSGSYAELAAKWPAEAERGGS